MKNLTPLERVGLQLSIINRLQDVFIDIKSELDITPEFIQEALARFMSIATGDSYHITKSVRVGFGELQSISTNITVPEPVREPLAPCCKYYVPKLGDKEFTDELEWYEDEYDYRYLDGGFIHLDRESAEIHARAIMSLTGKNNINK
ncbi:hypothetical protein [Xenorhabdus kozodoii]|uniref:Phage protein n=1 Tax=Xenorhabdus kozodoii TaxID=351676 RepID=A0A2D0LDB0_9GAMM|nr:hypothetical protein [Xenorhabdus kozodoii]PHM73686.1 hypothetical protein Xkoz_01507 [Xenorhabdus kozodoii]